MEKKSTKMKRSSTRVIALGFALIILAGAFLLSLPIATRTGSPNAMAALFTATSATCVTGLAVADTYQNWTLFGQFVILCMIQVGGLGFMTIGVYISVLLKRRIGLQERETLHESVNTLEIAGVVRLVKSIVKGALCIELLGAALLSIRFIPKFGLAKGIYFSIFHSISAFCNAGFDLMGIDDAYSSFKSFEGDILVNLVICSLILVGGIGFIVWDDIARNKWHFKRYLLHTKLALSMTLVLTVGGSLLFLVFENNTVFADMSVTERLTGALFALYMFIGGSPGSTAGGVKTTTIVVLLFYAIAMVLNRQDINVFGRRLTDDVVKKANAVVAINFSLAAAAAVIIMAMQPQLGFADVIFEVLSAIGTTGMTMGITRDLNTVSRLIIIFLMYCGRLGSLSFALVFARKSAVNSLRLPQERIIVG